MFVITIASFFTVPGKVRLLRVYLEALENIERLNSENIYVCYFSCASTVQNTEST